MLKKPKKFGTGIEYTGYTTPAAESPPPFHLLRFAFRPTKDTLRTQPAPLCVRSEFIRWIGEKIEDVHSD